MSSPREQGAGESGQTIGYEQPNVPGQAYQEPAAFGQDPAVYAQDPAYQEQEAYAAYGTGAAARPSAGRRAAIAGFTGLAGAFLILSGIWGVLVGIVGLANGQRIFSNTKYTFRYGIHAWGWTELFIGIALVAVGMCVLLGMAWARMVGVVLAVISAVANFMFIPRQPLWSITLIALDALVIWALLQPRRGEAR